MVSKLEQHLGKGESFVIDNDEFELKPIGVQFFVYIKKMKPLLNQIEKNKDKIENEKISESEMLEFLDEESLKALEALTLDTLRESFPDEKEKTIKQFANKYMFSLVEKIIETNVPKKTHEQIKKARTLEAMRNGKRPGQNTEQEKA